jgi:2-C-methyl-D-erythritol 2,4-cyclodiphosphate synthase
MRIGHGFDVHRFAPEFNADKPLILGGCLLPEQRSLLAHSDGDVVLHALCDALLGAAALGDIGEHFPDTDEQIAGIDSARILEESLKLLAEHGFQPVNIDITIVAQVPRIGPHRQAMRERLEELTGMASGTINVKATTTEKMGYIGREEGIACHAIVLLSSQR